MTFEQYATARLPALLGTARAICGDASLAKDLVQDVLIKLHARWAAVESVEAPDAYVRRMLVNEFLSWRRKWARVVPHAEPPITYVPTGVTLQAVVSSSTTRDGVGGTAGLDSLIDFAPSASTDPLLTVEVGGLALAGPAGQTPVVIAGQTWTWDGASHVLRLVASDHFIDIQDVLGDNFTLPELEQVAAGIQMTPNFGDRGSWFDAQTALH